MWFVQPKQDYVSQIPWKHADEPDVMSWRIRARNYNIFVANIFVFCFVFCLFGVGVFNVLWRLEFIV